MDPALWNSDPRGPKQNGGPKDQFFPFTLTTCPSQRGILDVTGLVQHHTLTTTSIQI